MMPNAAQYLTTATVFFSAILYFCTIGIVVRFVRLFYDFVRIFTIFLERRSLCVLLPAVELCCTKVPNTHVRANAKPLVESKIRTLSGSNLVEFT